MPAIKYRSQTAPTKIDDISQEITSETTPLANNLIILDFETSGLSPKMGDRAIEIGAVRIINGEVVDSFQKLMNPGFRIDPFIEKYTGITHKMLVNAPSSEDVMFEFSHFIGDSNLVAHNASFDKRFLDAEFRNISMPYTGEFACSMLLSRRIYQKAPDHKLGTLIKYKKIPSKGKFHRALYDSQMTAKLWVKMLDDIEKQVTSKSITFSLVQKLSKAPMKKVRQILIDS